MAGHFRIFWPRKPGDAHCENWGTRCRLLRLPGSFERRYIRCFEIPTCVIMIDIEPENGRFAYPLRQRIAEAGWQRCTTTGHGIYSRMREWLAVAEKMMKG